MEIILLKLLRTMIVFVLWGLMVIRAHALCWESNGNQDWYLASGVSNVDSCEVIPSDATSL